MTRALSFVWTPFGVVVGVLMVVAAAVLCFAAWHRSGYSRTTGIMEGLRFTLVLMVAITINQPEWLETFTPDEQPTVVVLSDISRSMETRDVIDPDNPNVDPQTRAEALKPLIEKSRWESASEELQVVFATFSSKLSNPSDGTDMAQALDAVLAGHPNLRGVVLMGDGDWNVGSPPALTASKYRLKNVPIYGVGVGSESRLPDIDLVRVDALTFGVVNKPMRIPFVIESAMPRDQNVTVTLTPSSGEAVTKQITIPAMGTLEDAILWHPKSVGEFELTVSVPVNPDELVKDNNERTVPISIKEEALKVLLVESFPRWEYRYLRNALERDPGVEVSCLLFHPGLTKTGGGRGYIKEFPEDLDALSEYDVVFLGDVGMGDGQLTAEQCRLIKGLVHSQASGLILMPGFRGGHLSLMGSELDELYPVALDATQSRGWGARVPAQFELTESGRRSLLTRLENNEEENARLWESLPGFQWYAPVLRAKVGTEVLATHKTETNRFGRVPLLVTRTYGTGKILFMGTDAAWRWREGVEDLYHYRFWGQVARWMAYQRSMAQGDLMRLFYSPDRPNPGDVVTLNANVMSNTGEPLQSGNVVVQVVAPSGKTDTVRLRANGDEWGLFTGSFTPEEPGDYQLKLSCRENGSSVETRLAVQGEVKEQLGKAARFDVLDEIATISRGRMADGTKIEELINEIAQLPEPDPEVRRLRLWCHPIWAGTLVFLLGVFWTGRKMIGVI